MMVDGAHLQSSTLKVEGEDCEFKNSLGYIVTFYPEKK